jgi:hypothetical protein
MANLPHITRFGLPGIARLAFGMHACHLSSNRDQLVGALVPYFVAGLRGNERCLWVTAPPVCRTVTFRTVTLQTNGFTALTPD